MARLGCFTFLSLVLVSVPPCPEALDNGLVRTPPMGWLSWERFRCNVDCESDPDNCISEKLFKKMADLIVTEGYVDVGYEYVIIDDCWLANERDADGNLAANSTRFPSGIKKLASYIHDKGLKFGIYEDYGTHTCAGYPGLLGDKEYPGYMEQDAKTLASWDIDYIKIDGCNSDPKTMDTGFTDFGKYLNQTGRKIVYSCEWPFYQNEAGMKPNYDAVAEHCNLWRNFNDVDDSWDSVLSIADFCSANQDVISRVAGPGAWNDPDMLVIGNFGLSYEQSKVQMALWAVLASPLIMSVDLRTIKSDYKDILQNRDIIAVNQDPLGIQGKRIYSSNDIEVWSKPLSSSAKGQYSFALAFVNLRTDGAPSEISVALKDLGLTFVNGYSLKDLYSQKTLGTYKPDTMFKTKINPTGVILIRADAVPKAN